jgi:cell division protein FtsW
MALFSRTDRSLLGRWWWSVDRPLLVCFLALMFFGVMLTMAGSPPVAERLGLDSFHFVKRHVVMLIPTIALMIFFSFLDLRNMRLISLISFLVIVGLLIITPFLGTEIKGAKRWLNLGGFSLQASEFLKPVFCMMNAWIFSHLSKQFPAVRPWQLSIGLFCCMAFLLLLQPDLGMTVVITAIWAVQFFMTGLSFQVIAVIGISGIVGLFGAYFLFPHVSDRINKFLFVTDDKFGASYQIEKSLNAFRNGGLWGQGPGEGVYKKHLPDAHADFIFSVAGEEFGLIVCAILVGVFGVIFFRTLVQFNRERNFFAIIAGVGLVVSFTFQAVINMSSALNLIPTKGMTLPFVSYGGSSLLALGIHTGLILGLTRRRMEQR